jgi:hypothetical protein
MSEVFIPRSSNLVEVSYDAETQQMDITFQDGRAWRYSGVPQAIFLGIQNAASAGSYFYRQVRGRFPEEEI